ncbi:MAG TPA: putative zinc-binding metallopeptidase, partial [Ramlibacter sp.]|nr:putative zinc-binding metallopeptidase [Ramlibacter sp.]
NPFATLHPDFDTLVEQWVPITLLVNSLNRSLGQEDAYPFALSAGALRKLRYVHDIIQEVRDANFAARKAARPA